MPQHDTTDNSYRGSYIYRGMVRKLKTGVLLYMFWGASLMWLVDAVVEYLESGAEYFQPAGADMLNDAFLGLSVIALALVIWVIVLMVKDPTGALKSAILSKKSR